MDQSEQQLLQEILNELKKQNSSARQLTKSFTNGLFSALGSFLGTAVFTVFVIYLFAQFSTKLIKPTTKFFEDVIQNIKWEKIIPQPKF